MKYYLLEPSYKKSIVEFDTFRRPMNEITQNDEDKEKFVYLEREMGSRWGQWFIAVPETNEEIKKWFKNSNYDGIHDFKEDYGFDNLDGAELMHAVLVPNTDDESVYIDDTFFEFVESYDACWEDWNVRAFDTDLGDTSEMIDEIVDAYGEEYEEGVEALGWEYVDSNMEMTCPPKIIECDKDGKPLQET